MPPHDQPRSQSAGDGETEVERLAREGYVAYFGRYTVDESNQTFVTEVEGALNPTGVGTKQLRHWSLDGNTLTLRPPSFPDGTVGELVWERVS